MKLGMTLNFIWKNKHTRIVKKTLRKKKLGGAALPEMKACHKASLN